MEAAAPVVTAALVVAAAQLVRAVGSRCVVHWLEVVGNRCRYWRQLGDDGSGQMVQWLEAAGSRRVVQWLQAVGSRREVQWLEAAGSRQEV